jgi:hypothetical protein
MQVHRVIAAPCRAAMVVALATIVSSGCSSSTEAARNVTPDGFRISVTVTPDTVQVGGYLTITMIAENTTSETIRRAFPPNNFGPEPAMDLSYFEPDFGLGSGFFSELMEFGSADTLTLAPHAQASGAWQLRAVKAGTTTIAGCFPKSNDGLLPQVCDTRSLTIVAP